ncbi:MAG: class 1 fructose-bisphosphatase [Campylobacterota bacterium]|nr:class 1 fructose-bisphosphatase [Campylobacterota bacterium]
MEEIIKSIEKSTLEIKRIIEKGDSSKSEEQNSTGDTQLKLDIKSDVVIENNFKLLNSVKQIVSEEQEHIIDINKDGEYLIAYDPLDGSSLVDVNLAVGSIYAIYKNSFTASNILASIYVVFGSKVEMVVSYNDSVKLYMLNGEKFNYIRDVKMDEKGSLASPGSTQKCWYPHHRDMVNFMFDEGYKLNYSGGMVPDLHHILLKGGGLFSYPGATDKPKGKLRQLFEVFPFAHIFETAGGGAIDGKDRLLDVESSDNIHDTSPCFFGSNYEIKIVKKYHNI